MKKRSTRNWNVQFSRCELLKKVNKSKNYGKLWKKLCKVSKFTKPIFNFVSKISRTIEGVSDVIRVVFLLVQLVGLFVK